MNFNPGGGSTVSGSEALVIDSLTLGGTIWYDNGAGGGIAGNGIRDGTEAGVDGVALSLFVDANNDNVADTPGTPLVTTADRGRRRLQLHRARAGQLHRPGRCRTISMPAATSRCSASARRAGNPDPDNNVDNDDNGLRRPAAPRSAARSRSPTIPSPPPGTGNDTNNTLDFGFAALNQAPVNTVPGAQSVNEDLSLIFNPGNANAISVSDADAGSGNLTVTLSVSQGTLTLNGTAGLSFANGDGSADSSMTFSGTSAAINNALNRARLSVGDQFQRRRLAQHHHQRQRQ